MTRNNDGATIDEFVQRAVQPPARMYYCLLFTPKEQRDAAGATVALRHEFIESSLATPEVANTRLAWWGEEVARLANGKPRHPLTRTLMNACPQSRTTHARLCAEMVGAAQAACLSPLPEDLAGTEHRLGHDWGALCRLFSGLLESLSGADAEAAWVGEWSGALGLAVGLREIVTTEEQRQQSRMRLHQAIATLPAEARFRQRPLLVLASGLEHELRHLSEESARTATQALYADASATSPGRWHGLGNAVGALWRAWTAASRATRGKLPANLARMASPPERT
jgi:hypothetical protein